MRRNLALRLVFPLLAVGLILSAPSASLAAPITFNAEVLYTTNTATVTINPILTNRSVYTEYTLRTDLFGDLDAFCVQNVLASRDSELYELVPVPGELATAAWLAEHYWGGDGIGTKEDYQIAIWSVVFGSGFTYHSGANDDNIDAILALTPGTPSNMVSLAHNPVGDWNNSGYQDFLVKHAVPEPSTMLLLGFGLIGLAGIGRKTLRT